MASPAQADDPVRAQLNRITASHAFRRAEVLSAFLRFAVDRYMSGNTKDLKEYTIAVEVLKRPASYDPQVDSHVRVQAGKLRARLERYYQTEGKRDPVVISLPKGAYVPEIQRRSDGRSRVGLVVLAGVAMVAAVAVWYLRPFASVTSVAVLPFENLTGSPENDYVAAAIGDQVTNSFSRREGVITIGRDTMSRYRNRAGEAERIGRELGVRSVVSGRITRQGERLSVQTELSDTRTAKQIWGGRIEGKADTILSISEEVTRSVSAALGLTAPPKPSTWTNAEAYLSFIKARHFLNKRSPKGFLLARDLFADSVARDPRAVEAYAGLTEVTLTSCFYAAVRTQDALPEARHSAEKALALAPHSAMSHVAMGFVRHYELDEPAHEAELDAALRLDPLNTTALRWKGLHHMWSGRHSESRPYFERALKLEPLSVPANVNIGEQYFYARDYARAAEVYRQVIELDPSYFWAYERLGQTYEQMGRHREAIEAFDRALALSDEPRVIGGSLGHVYAVSGRRVEARKVLKDLLERSRTQYVPPYGIAVIYAGLGDNDQALAWLEAARRDRSTWMSWLRVDPRLDQLRKDARFEVLIGEASGHFATSVRRLSEGHVRLPITGIM